MWAVVESLQFEGFNDIVGIFSTERRANNLSKKLNKAKYYVPESHNLCVYDVCEIRTSLNSIPNLYRKIIKGK